MGTLIEEYNARVAAGTLQADPVQTAVLPALERVREGLATPAPRGLFRRAPEPVRGLYLWGGVGRGKSMLMDLLFEAIDVPKQRKHFHGFMQEVHKGIAAARARGVTDAIAPVADALVEKVRFLAFDEMQITDITDAMIVGRLFERLFAGGVKVVVTSNRVPDDLYKTGLNRALFVPFIEMLKTRLDVVEMAGALDHRQGRLRGETRYFAPTGAAARKAMDAVWQRLTGGAGGREVLRVLGRDVEIPLFFNGVARIGFADLCSRPLGPADYLALAEAARVLLIDDIPRLGSENFNQAKRFVTLVDTLYEARVQLFCSAAAQPDMLYVEGEGAFEFGRTASRLEEMQSEEWGP